MSPLQLKVGQSTHSPPRAPVSISLRMRIKLRHVLLSGGVAEKKKLKLKKPSQRETMSSRRSSRITELDDLARNTDGLSLLAASGEILTKSAVGFESAERETWRDAIRHAWTPSSRQNLSSSSSRFRGKVEPNYRGYAVAVGIVPSIESLRNFGRVRESNTGLNKNHINYIAAQSIG